MDWIVFAYSLPSKQGSSFRVALWRRLRRWGAISVPGGAYVLPARGECVEAFQWLAQEIRATNGKAVLMRVDHFEGLTDSQLIDLLCTARGEDYLEIESQLSVLDKTYPSGRTEDPSHIMETISKLRRRFADISRVDYFNCMEGRKLLSHFEAVEQRFSPKAQPAAAIPKKEIAHYCDKVWVTRPHPFVDRLGSIWLIRRFIDPHAEVRYSETPGPSDVAFDMSEDEFGHRGNLCTFETLMRAFNLEFPGLRPISEIVHEIDLHDGRYAWPEIAGVEAILNGWTLARLPDAEVEVGGVALFEGLYRSFSKMTKPGTESAEILPDRVQDKSAYGWRQ